MQSSRGPSSGIVIAGIVVIAIAVLVVIALLVARNRSDRKNKPEPVSLSIWIS
jgi:hypothetical protein